MIRDAILDVGAFIGETVAQTYTFKYPYFPIYAFEPCRRTFPQLERNVGAHPNVKRLLQVAVDVDETPKTFYESLDPLGSSLSPLTGDVVKWKVENNTRSQFEIVNTYTVPCTRLDNFLKIHTIKTVELLKVDARGKELQVIQSLGNHLKDVRTIQARARLTDFSLYQGDCSRDVLVQYMKDNGFSAVGSQKQTFDQEENILFIRD